jgi:DNA-binding Lrp family transcriptional regulator
MDSAGDTDTKILRELRSNARQSASTIASEIGEDQERVADRIAELEESGAIRAYRANIDPAKVGYSVQSYHFVGAADNWDRTLELGLPTYNRWAGVQLVMVVLGQYDLILRKVNEDNKTYNNFAKNIINNPNNPAFVRRESYRIDERYRWNGADLPKTSRYPPDPYDLDPLERDLLIALQKDATLRDRPGDLADAVGGSPSEVTKAVENLEQDDVILDYTVDIDVSELGWYRALLGLSAIHGGYDSAVEELMDLDPLYVPYITSGSGFNWSDVAVELVVRSVEHLDQLTDEIRIECDAKETRTFLSTNPLQDDLLLDLTP